MLDPRRLIREIHRRSVWQVLAVYVVSGWVVLQFVDTLAGALNLPEWASPLALFLLVLGLPVVLATAVVQGRPASDDEPVSSGDADAAAGLAGIRRHLTWPRALLGGLVAFSVLFGVAGLFVILGDDVEPPPTDPTTVAEPAVAVLPFAVHGLDLDTWGEGLVSLISSMVDGVAGVRAISGRTVLHRWGERVGGPEADLETSLAVARDVGARFALVGSAVASGPTTRLELELYEASSGERLGNTRIDGDSNDLMMFTDRAAAEIARAVLEARGGIPDFELEPLTDSPEALLAFLEGEVAFRNYRLIEAREAFRRAVAVDTAFAFAHLRLSEVAQWGPTVSSADQAEHREAAARHVDRLTERSAIRVRAHEASGLEAVSILRDAVDRFPDDAVLWYELGETLIHGSEGFPGLREIETAFRRSLELEPDRGATYPHMVHLVFMESADTAEARRLVRRFGEIAPDVEGPYTADADPRIGPHAFDLVFGSEAERAATWAGIDTLPPLYLLALSRYVYSPRHWDAYERVNLAVARHPEAEAPGGYFGTMKGTAVRSLVIGYALWRGQPGRALEFATGDQMALGPNASESRALLYFLHALDLPIPDEILEREFGPARIDSTSLRQTVFAAGALAVDRGRWRDFEAAIGELGRRGSSAAAIELLEAYGAWKRGDVDAAIEVFERRHPGNRIVQWWLGDAYVEAGRLEEAERVFASYGWNQWFEPFNREPLAQLRLAGIYEALDRPAAAIGAYGYFLEHWEDAESGLRPMVEDARTRLEALLAERG